LTGIKNTSKVSICLDRAEAIKRAWRSSVSGDIIMVLGKGAETHMEIKGRKIAFKDEKIILELEN
ncbi:MAG: UDP-N-acetylmuramoyl-L-alanyl-D-glutamate--2,6-diaminopimelate ligase, partial [Candidatus Neomarinimicrobiota bacterium]